MSLPTRNRLFVSTLAAFCLPPCFVGAQANPAGWKSERARQRAEWFYQQRAYPLGYIPAGARLAALEALDRMLAAEGRLSKRPLRPALQVSSTQWTQIGPQPATTPFWLSPVSGRVTALAVDPRNPSTVYLGAAEGGVWKTTEAGQDWVPLTDMQPSLSIGALALDLTNPNIVYAGTGSLGGFYGAGVLKSVDGGSHWTHLPGPFVGPFGPSQFFDGGARIRSLAVHPLNPQILLAGVWRWPLSEAGIFRSTDGGVTWSRVLTGPGSDVQFDSSGSMAYAALGNFYGHPSSGIHRSADAGLTWTAVRGSGANALPAATDIGVARMAFSPPQPSTVYAFFRKPSSNEPLGIFKTADSGLNWTRIADTSDFRTCCDILVAHPKNQDVVLAGGTFPSSIFRSLDGGMTWKDITGIQVGNFRVAVHADVHSFGFSADGAKLYLGNDGGVYSTTDVTASTVNWTSLNATLATVQFYPGMSMDPRNVNRGFAGAQDHGTLKYSGGPIWEQVGCGDGGPTAIDFSAPDTVYATCQRIDIQKSMAGAALGTWSQTIKGIDTSDRSPFIPAFVMDPSNSQRLYFGTARLYQTNDGAGSWTAISPDLTKGQGVISAIAVAPRDANTVYVGASDGKVQVTLNALSGPGATWNDRTAGLPNRFVTQVAADPQTSLTAYVTFSGFSGFGGDQQGHVFKTTNGGLNWTDLSSNLPNIPVNDVVVDPDLANTLYVGTDIGVFRTSDGGATWSPLGDGLPRVVVLGLRLHRSTRTLLAATHGRSMWDLQAPLPSKALPALHAGGTVNAASFARGGEVAPGSIASVFGANLASSLAIADRLPLPTSLGGAGLQFNNNVPVPAFFASPGQMNVQIPWELTGQIQALLSVVVGGITYQAVAVSLAPFAPGIFTTNQQGTGQGAVLISDTGDFAAPAGSVPGRASRPAKRGEFLTIFCTGLGGVTKRPASGAAASGSQLSETTAMPAVTLGGVPATVSFSGLAPGFVGLYQVNVQVPPEAPTGNAVPLALTIGSASSNSVTVAIQ